MIADGVKGCLLDWLVGQCNRKRPDIKVVVSIHLHKCVYAYMQKSSGWLFRPFWDSSHSVHPLPTENQTKFLMIQCMC